MKLSDHDLRQIDEEAIRRLAEGAVKTLAIKLLDDPKEARERLNQNSQNSSRPPGGELPWEGASAPSEEETEEGEGLSTDDEDAEEEGSSERLEVQESEFTGGAETAPVPPPRRRRGKQAGAPGYGREQALAVHGEEHHHPVRCACCDHPLGEGQGGPAYTAFYTLDIRWGEVERPGITVVHTKHLYYETACGCGHRTRAVPCRAAPDALLPKIALSQWRLVGPGLAALIVCLAYRMRLSRPRIREFLHDWLGIRLSVGTIHRTLAESGRAALPLEEAMVEEVRQSGLLHVDETAWKESRQLLWLWVFSTSGVVVYWIAHRTAELLQNVLGESYPGWLMSDGYRLYRAYPRRLRCRAHLVRKARGLAEGLDPAGPSLRKKDPGGAAYPDGSRLRGA